VAYLELEMDAILYQLRLKSKHLRIMNAMTRDLKAVMWNICENEHVVNMIQIFPYETEHWRSFKFIIAHNENIKTFEAISKHLKTQM